jgi:hypothetical protein
MANEQAIELNLSIIAKHFSDEEADYELIKSICLTLLLLHFDIQQCDKKSQAACQAV